MEGVKISQVVFDTNVPNVIIAVSKENQVIQYFEAKGKGNSLTCKFRGSLKMGEFGIVLDHVQIQPSNNLFYISMKQSNEIGIMKYDPKSMISSLLKEQPEFHELTGDQGIM